MRTIALTLLLSLALPALADDTAPATPAPAADSSAPAETTAITEMPTGTIYLLGRVQRAGTELDQAVFWQDRTVTSLEQCEKIRKDGVTTSWTAFHPYLKIVKGMAYKVDYRCVKAEQRLSIFRIGNHFEDFYMVHTDDGKLRLQPFNSFFACQNTLEARGMASSLNNFCAATSQRVLQKKNNGSGYAE